MRFLACILGLALAACSTQAPAQSALLQAGPAASGRAPMYVNSGNGQAVVTDSGPASGGAVGLGMGEGLYVARGTGTPPYASQGTGPLGTNWCDYDAPITNATGYHYLCMSPNANGGGLINYGAGGSASNLPFDIIVNGTSVFNFDFNTLADNLTSTGVSQATALPINASINAFTTVASGTGTILPTVLSSGTTISGGYGLEVINAGANPVAVYPPTGQSINGGSANAAVTVYMNASAHFIYRGLVSGTGAWYAR